MAKFWIFSQILITDVVTADPGHTTVHHHHLAVVAKVDLKSVAFTFAGVERRHRNTGRFQFLNIGAGQVVTADFIKKELYAHPFLGLVDQM